MGAGRRFAGAGGKGVDVLKRGVPRGRVGGQHSLEQGGAGHDAISECNEVLEELLLFRDESDSEHATKSVTAMLRQCYRP